MIWVNLTHLCKIFKERLTITMERTITNNWWKIKSNKLIVVDGFSGLPHKSNYFGCFLAVSHKFEFTCVYLFHIYIRQNITGRWTFLRQNFSVFFLVLFSSAVYRKFYQQNVIKKLLTAYHREIFGWVDFTLKFQILE